MGQLGRHNCTASIMNEKSGKNLDKSQNKSQMTTEIPSQIKKIKLFSCSKCNKQFSVKKNCLGHVKICIEGPKCSKCDVSFCSQDSLKLHFNSCEGPEIEILAEKLQSAIMDKFSCSKCDMDFDLRESLEEHFGNCEIAMLQPGEEHLDHTYSKGVSTATSVKQGNLFRGIDNTTVKR